MVDPKNFYLDIDNTKYFLTNDNYDENTNTLKINPLNYPISTTSTITVGQYKDKFADSTTSMSIQPVLKDFPQFGSFPLSCHDYYTGTQTRLLNGDWQINLARSSTWIAATTAITNIETIDYLCLYNIDVNEIINQGIYEIIFEFDNIENNEVQYSIQNDSSLPILNYSNNSIITTINDEDWHYIQNNQIIMQVFDEDGYWADPYGTSEYASHYQIVSSSDLNYYINVINRLQKFIKNSLYIKTTNLSIQIKNITVHCDYKKFRRIGPLRVGILNPQTSINCYPLSSTAGNGIMIDNTYKLVMLGRGYDATNAMRYTIVNPNQITRYQNNFYRVQNLQGIYQDELTLAHNTLELYCYDTHDLAGNYTNIDI